MSSNEPPDMSGSGIDSDPDVVGPEDIENAFRAGAQQMREMLSRFVEQGGDSPATVIAASMRLNWVPAWGKDPGRPKDVYEDVYEAIDQE